METKIKSQEEIKKEVTLEAMLNLLHQCLMPAELHNVVLKSDWWKEENGRKEAETNLTNLKNVAKKHNAPFNSEYMKKLEELKNTLLQS